MSNHPEFNPDSLDSKITELLTLQRLDVEDRAEFRKEVKAKLDGLTTRADYTNGRIADALKEIEEIKRVRDLDKKDIDDIVGIKRFAEKFLFNKYALIALGALTIGFFKIVTTPELRDLAGKILGF
jgi:hypothetical protein